jgi:hypothetical protein
MLNQLHLQNLQKYNHLFPQDVKDSTVVHLRLGDSLGDHFYEKRLRYLRKHKYDKKRKTKVKDKCRYKFRQ